MDQPRTNRQKRAMETRAKIVAAAKKVIAEKGFHHVSIEEIAREAKVATGSFYTYFKCKEDVIEAINQTDFYRLAELANELPDTDITKRLSFYCKSFLSAIEEIGIEICRQWIRNNLSPAEMDIRGEKITKYAYDYRAMQEVLNAAVKRGELTENAPVDELALYINAELYGLMVAWCMSDAKVIGSEKTEQFCKTVISPALAPYLPPDRQGGA